MGLDISAYNKLQVTDALFNASGDPVNRVSGEEIDGLWISVFINPSFPGRADEFKDGAIYLVSESMDFRAGSYGGYNRWRESLAALGGYAPKTGVDGGELIQDSHTYGCWHSDGGPFFELINFSDCEGFIGTAVSSKLARDFAEFDEKAKASMESYDYELYAKWRRAFELASDGGGVKFW